jgi:hypothetical protein
MMKQLSRLWRRTRFPAFAVLSWLALHGLAWAQAGGAPGAGQKTEEPPPAYVLPYVLVIVCLGIGLTIVLNSAKRRERAKPEVYGEPK